MNKKLLLLVLLLLPLVTFGQGGAAYDYKTNQYFANEFGIWSATLADCPKAVGATTCSTGSSRVLVFTPQQYVVQGINSFTPIANTTKIILDSDNSNNETVTLSSVNCPSGGTSCTAQATTTLAHARGAVVTTGSAGVQEAINSATPTSGFVIINNKWPGTTGMFTGASGNTSVMVIDVRAGSWNYYGWNGSNYVSLLNINASIGGFAPSNAKYILQTVNAGLTNAQVLASLATGLVKNTTTTGVLSIATAGNDYENPLTFNSPITRATNTISCATCALTTTTITAGTGLTGGGDLSANRTITLSTPVSVANGGTNVSSLSDVLGTANQITVTSGTARVIGGNVTLALTGPFNFTTLTTNGVLYGNSTSTIQATAQGVANSVLTANAGAPVFSATPTVTSITTTGLTNGRVVLVGSGGLHTDDSDLTFLTDTLTATKIVASNQLAVGGSIAATVAIDLIPTFTGSTSTIGLRLSPTLTSIANTATYAAIINPTIIEAGSGTHSLLAALAISPTITNGAAATTDVVGMDISVIAAPTGTVNTSGLRIAAPTGGSSTNYAINVISGSSTLAGIVGLGAAPIAGIPLYVSGAGGSNYKVVQVDGTSTTGGGIALKASGANDFAIIATGAGAGQGTNKLVFTYNSATTDLWLMDSSGNLIPGANDTQNIGSATKTLGDIWILPAATGVGDTYICMKSDGQIRQGATCAASAEKFKENIISLDDSLSKVMKMRPVSFDYKHDASNDDSLIKRASEKGWTRPSLIDDTTASDSARSYLGRSRHSIGMIADELAQIDPTLVVYQFDLNTGKDEIYSIYWDRVTAVLVKAVQELTARIAVLEAK